MLKSCAFFRAMYAALLIVGMSAFIVSGCKGTQTNEPAYRGVRGETCQSRNDCEKGLACIQSTCVLNDYPIAQKAGQCEVIECRLSADCCTQKPAWLDFECDTSQQEYQDKYYDCKNDLTPGEPIESCDDEERNYLQYAALQYEFCNCTEQCVDNRCEPAESDDAMCTKDADCAYLVYGRPYCVAGMCVACTADQQCQEQHLQDDPASWYCGDGGVCAQKCTVDSNCPIFHSCDKGACVESNCSTDRECALWLNDVTAACNAETGQCEIRCSSNADCNPDGPVDGSWNQQICDDGLCTFIGCESDAECRSALDMEQTADANDVVCSPM